MTAPVRIALDAFGGDDCPDAEVRGALEAARGGVHVVLVGDEARLRHALAAHGDWQSLPLEIHHAPQTIAMDDSPSKAVRGQARRLDAGAASTWSRRGRPTRSCPRELRGDAGVRPVQVPPDQGRRPPRPGHQPADRHGSGVGNGRPHGGVPRRGRQRRVSTDQPGAVRRPGRASTPGSSTAATRPRVGLLSNGSEDSKGTELTRAAHALPAPAARPGRVRVRRLRRGRRRCSAATSTWSSPTASPATSPSRSPRRTGRSSAPGAARDARARCAQAGRGLPMRRRSSPCAEHRPRHLRRGAACSASTAWPSSATASASPFAIATALRLAAPLGERGPAWSPQPRRTPMQRHHAPCGSIRRPTAAEGRREDSS